jgi:hypothetical protein
VGRRSCKVVSAINYRAASPEPRAGDVAAWEDTLIRGGLLPDDADLIDLLAPCPFFYDQQNARQWAQVRGLQSAEMKEVK